MAALAASLEAVLGNVVVATALAGVAYAVGRWARRPALAHTLWLLVLVKLVTPPLIAIPVRCLPAEPDVVFVSPPVVAPTQPAPVARGTSDGNSTTSGVTPETPHAPPESLWPTAGVVSETITPPFAPPAGEAAPRAVWLLYAAWLAGSLACLALAVTRVRRFSRLLQLATAPPGELAADVAAVAERMRLRRTPIARVVAGGIAPLVWAIGRPVVYFPAGLLARLSPDQRLTVVAHELAHVRRWDHLVRWVEFAIVSVYWWCPLAWIARRELRRREEEACDAEVTAVFPGSGFAYASAVLETIDYLAGAPPRFRAASGMASGIGEAESLRQRLILILEGGRVSSRGSTIARAVVLVAAVAFLVFGPKLARSTAEAIDAPVVEIAAPALARPTATDGFVEPTEEAVQFAANPVRVLGPAGGRGACSAAILTPDGRRLLLVAGSTAVVWDRATKRAVVTLSGHTDTITAVAISPDGQTIATAGNDGVAKLWSAADGRFLHTLPGHGRWVTTVTFSPDGRTVVTAGYDRIVRLWNVATGESLAALSGHTAAVRAAAFSPDGRTLATGGADHQVRLWDLTRRETARVLAKHTATVRAVVFSLDGSRLATGSEDRTVRVWNPVDGREVGSPVAVPDFVTALGFSARGGALLAGTSSGHLLNIDPATALARGYLGVAPGSPDLLPAHAATVTSVLADPASGSMLTVSRDRTVLEWPPVGAAVATRAFRSGSHLVSVVALSPDGRVLATGGPNGAIRLWDAATARELGTLPGHPGGVAALVFAPGGRLVSTGADERVRVWDTTTGQALHTVVHRTPDLHVALSPDGRTLAVGGRTLPGVALWDLTTGTLARRVGTGEGEVTAVAFAPSGDRIATGYADGMIRFWNVASGDEVQRGPVGGGRVDGISFSTDGATAAVVVNSDGPTGDDEATTGPVHAVVFWDVRDATPRDTPRPLAHPGPVTAAAFTADGRRVVTAARDGNLYLWDAETGRLTRTVRAHRDAVRGVAVLADGTAVYSAGDRAAKWWPMPPANKPSTQTSNPAP